MAKVNKRMTIKGKIDLDKGVIIETDKDGNIIEFPLTALFSGFEGLDGVTMNLAYDEEITTE